MNNSEYWRKRVEELEKAQILNEAKYVVLLKEEYEKALSSIKKETESWLARFSINNQISLKESKKWLNANELKELQWDVNEYIKYGQENGIDLIWKKELENASAKVHISRFEALQLQIQNEIEKLSFKEQKSTQEFILDTYTDTYNKLAYEIQKGNNVAFHIAPLDTDTLKKVISKPWTTDNLTFSDRIWKNKKSLIDTLQKDLTQSIIKGEGPDKVIEKISKDFNVSKNRASTLVMSESAFFGSSARKKCFKDLWVQKYENVATLDSHTSEICREIDGTVFDMSDYEEGTTAPPFHVRCRTTTAPYFGDEFEFGERAARNTDGKTYYVPSNIKYEEWEKKFVNKTSTEKTETKLDKSLKEEQKNDKIVQNENVGVNDLSYIDITDEMYAQAKPYKGTVKKQNFYEDNGTKYKIDGHNVVYKHDQRELEVAQLLNATFGGNVNILPNINFPQGIKSPDYLYKGEKTDLKRITSSRAKDCVKTALKNKEKQANNFIIDNTAQTVSDEDIIKQIEKLYENKGFSWIDKIYLLRNKEFIKIFKRK